MNRLKQQKKYIWICFACILGAEFLGYFVTGRLIDDASLHDLTCRLDRLIPFRPAWVTVYFLAYAFWVEGCFRVLSESPEHAYRITAAYVLAMAVSAVIFLAWPGTLQRPDPAGDGFFLGWVRLLYRIDEPKNLCPSLHVLTSYYCWRGACGCRTISARYKWAAFIMLVLVSLSILFIKQHAIIDIPAAVIVAEGTLLLGKAFPRRWIPERWLK